MGQTLTLQHLDGADRSKNGITIVSTCAGKGQQPHTVRKKISKWSVLGSHAHLLLLAFAQSPEDLTSASVQFAVLDDGRVRSSASHPMLGHRLQQQIAAANDAAMSAPARYPIEAAFFSVH